MMNRGFVSVDVMGGVSIYRALRYTRCRWAFMVLDARQNNSKKQTVSTVLS